MGAAWTSEGGSAGSWGGGAGEDVRGRRREAGRHKQHRVSGSSGREMHSLTGTEVSDACLGGSET